MSHYTPSNTTCPIVALNVGSYQRVNDTVTCYPIRIQLYNTNQSYERSYSFTECVEFARRLRQQFTLSKSALPPFKKYYAFSKKGKNQKYIDRQAEIQEFCKKLLQLSSVVTCSDLFLSFFTEKQHQQTSVPSSTLKRVFTIKSPKTSVSNDKLLFFQSPPPPTMISEPCKSQEQRKSIISTASNRSSTTSSMLFSSSSVLDSSEEEGGPTIKLKIVYDCNTIVIIRESRSIPFHLLVERVIQKFALLGVALPANLRFSSSLENARYSSASSIITHSDSLDPGTTVLITNEEQLVMMQTKWSGLSKVTLRCMV